MLTFGSTFTGLGGLELGLEQAGLGHTVWQVESNRKVWPVLERYWPRAKRYADVREVGVANLAPVDLICGGFPCQDISSAGKRAGLSGARSGLWYEFARVVEEMRPWWVVVENVTSGACKWVDPIRGALAELGYASLPVTLQASDLGAPHRRSRIFIVASNGDFRGLRLERRRGAAGPETSEPARVATDRDHERHAREQQGWCATGVASEQGEALAHRDHEGEPLAQVARSGDAHHAAGHRQASAHADDQRRDVRDESEQARLEVQHAPRHHGWAVEPAVARVVHGIPGRVDRQHALGNAVVPAQAETIGHLIRSLIDG